MYALNIAEDGRVLSATFSQYAPGEAVQVLVLPEGNIVDYIYKDGKFIYDPLPKPEEPNPWQSEYVSWAELETALREGVNSI